MRRGFKGRRPRGFSRALIGVLTHVATGALVLSVVLTLAWCVSLLLKNLHAHPPFPPGMYRIVAAAELGLLYVDIAISGVFFLMLGGHFIRRTWEER